MLNGESTPRAVVRVLPAVLRRMLLLVLTGIGFLAVSMSAAPSPPGTIVFFGDSLTAGYGLEDPTVEAYPALIGAKLEAEHLPWRAVNAGVSGDTSAGGLRRVDWILRQPITVFVLALGANDGLRGIDPSATAQNLEQIIKKVRAKYPSVHVVVCGMVMPPAMGETYTRRYRETFPAVAEKTGATLLPFLLEGVAGKPDLNQPDAMHPTAAGQRIVADNVWKTIRPLL